MDNEEAIALRAKAAIIERHVERIQEKLQGLQSQMRMNLSLVGRSQAGQAIYEGDKWKVCHGIHVTVLGPHQTAGKISVANSNGVVFEVFERDFTEPITMKGEVQ